MNYLYGFLSYISFKMNMPTFARGFFKKSLSMKPGSKEPAVSIYVRRSHHAPLLEMIDRSNVNNQYQAYLKAVVHRHERNYKKAYEYIANDDHAGILNLKVRLLYDLKSFRTLISLSKEGHDVLTHLNDRQQRTLVKYLVSTNHFEDAERLFENSEVENDRLFDDLQAAKDDIFYEYNWRQYKVGVLGLEDAEPETIMDYKSYIDEQDGEMQSLGYVLLINQYFEKNEIEDILNSEFVPYINANQKLLKYINPAAVYKLNFNYTEDSDASIQLQNVLDQLYIGERSRKLIKELGEKLQDTQLTYQHVFSLRRLIIEGRLDLTDETFRTLFKKEQKLEPVFYSINLFIDSGAKDTVDAFVHREFDKKQKRRIYTTVIKQLRTVDIRSILPEHLAGYLEGSDGKLSNAIILAKHYFMTRQNEKMDALLKRKTRDHQLKIYIQMARFLFNTKHYRQSLEEAEKGYAINPDNPDVLRALIRAHHILGDIKKRYEYLTKLRRVNPVKIFPREFKMAEQEYRLFHRHWELPEGLAADIDTNNKKVLFVLNKALPVINGYTIRSNEIVKEIRESGYTPVVTTRLGWSPVHEGYDIPEKNINGVATYYIDKSDKYLTNRTPILDYFDAYARELKSIVEKEKPSIIHAASNFQNALPALKFGKASNIRTIYEVRGMWHHTQSSKIKGFQNSDRFNLQEQQEFHCCETADEVFCISESLKDYLIEHGIDEEKITVIPNGVDTKTIAPIEKDKDILKKYNLDKHYVLGFIGSVTSYEGLDLVIRAIHEMNGRVELDKKFKLLIVGDGQHRSHLQSLVDELGLQEYVIFTGRVPHGEIARYYSVMDIAPFARTNDLVCQLVTPLKTYEAMAMEKKVIVSDIPALREMVIEGENGLVFKAEDQDSLIDAIIHIIDDTEMDKNARGWVKSHRDWGKIISRIDAVYSGFEEEK